MEVSNVSRQLYEEQLPNSSQPNGFSTINVNTKQTVDNSYMSENNIEDAFQKQLDLSEYYKGYTPYQVIKKEYSDHTNDYPELDINNTDRELPFYSKKIIEQPKPIVQETPPQYPPSQQPIVETTISCPRQGMSLWCFLLYLILVVFILYLIFICFNEGTTNSNGTNGTNGTTSANGKCTFY